MRERFRFLALVFIAIAFVFSLSSCASTKETESSNLEEPVEVLEPTAPDSPSAEGWTILVYMCGSDLESDGGCATDDMVEIVNSVYSDKVRVVIQTGGSLSWQNNVVDPYASERYVRTEDGLVFEEALPEANMGDPSTLQAFLEWGLENYPAQHLGLVFWNHGGGSVSGVCFDERNGYDSLSLKEIETALEGVSSLIPGAFEFVGFDACLMSSLETANMLSPYACYLYASEETEPGTGWNYTALLDYLASNPDSDGRALGAVQCQSYYEYCLEVVDDPSVTFSIVDLSLVRELVSALDQVGMELLEAQERPEVIRGILSADNFGGNNRSEGYTNMVDLGDMLQRISSYVPSAEKALMVLDKAVVFSRNASQHKGAGGLSIYYPLSVQDSSEMEILAEICPSASYFDFVSLMAEGAALYGSSRDVGGSSSLSVKDVYLDEDGNYTVVLDSMEKFAFASACLYLEDEDGSLVYLGEDDDVVMDYDECIIQDNFDGSWLCMEEYLLPIELVSQNEDFSLYSCDVLRNGEYTYLQISYDWNTGLYRVLGTWNGVNSQTGMAARSAEPLRDADVLNIIYWYSDDAGSWDNYFLSDDIAVAGGLALEYLTLPSTDYWYAINVYDIYGNVYQLDYTVFFVDEEGEVYFYGD